MGSAELQVKSPISPTADEGTVMYRTCRDQSQGPDAIVSVFSQW
jgi:hypothetical protein